MTKPVFKRAVRILGMCLILTLSLALNSAGEKTSFSIADSLRVKSFSLLSLTESGRFIAGSISQRLDRLGTDHKRYRDPTYITPRLTSVVVLDTQTQTFQPLFKDFVQIQSAAWSPDGTTLAFFLLQNGAFKLHTYDRESQSLHEIRLSSSKPIASSSFLIWENDGSGILLALRADGWEEKSHAMFLEAAQGPIIVYDSREPFLKWDVIRDQASLQIPARVDLEQGQVEELLPESRYSDIRLAKNDSFLTYVETYPIKTEYGQNYYREGGREYTLFRLDMSPKAEPKALIERAEKRLNLRWNEENSAFAWADEGDIFVQSVKETEPRNLTKDKVKPEKAGTNADRKKPAKEQEPEKVRFSLQRWAPDGSQLLASTSKGYWLIDIQSGELEMVYTFPKAQDEEESRGGPQQQSVAAWSPDGRFLYLTYSAKDKWERGFTRYDLQKRQMQDLVKDGNLYRGLRMSKDGEKFYFSFSNGDLPNDLYMTDKNFSHKTRLTDLNPWVTEKHLTRSELIRYRDVDGRELYGVLYYPIDYRPGHKYPLVCEVYERFFDNGFNANMNIITNQGWFGLRPSVNLVTGYPGEAWVKGVTSAVNHLVEKGLVDNDKVGVHGTSYGGYATSLLIAQTDRFAAAVNISGKVDIISFLGDSPRIGHRNYGAAEAGQDRLGKTLWEAPLKYINHSAVFFADRIKTPHLLITGEGDWNVPAVNTRELYYALRRLGKECVWVNYWNDGHGLGSAADEDTYQDKWTRVLDWYKTNFAKANKIKEKS